jgi:hypothetical protein
MDMCQKHSIENVVPRRHWTLAILATTALLLMVNAAWALDPRPGFRPGPEIRNAGEDEAIGLVKVIPVPPTAANSTAGGMYSFDISWVDQDRRVYFIADRSNKAVDMVDTRTDTLIAQLAPTGTFAPFAGFVPCVPAAGANDCAGPNGVVTAEAPLPWLFVTDAPSRLLCFNFVTGQTVSQITTMAGEPTRADELAYSPQLGLILAINNAAATPFGTLIRVDKTTCGLTNLGNIFFDAAHGVDAQNGAEQPVWDPDTGRFYLSIPQIGSDVRNGGVLRISPAGAIEMVFPVRFCGPAGLTKGPDSTLLVGCNTVFDTAGNVWSTTGKVTAAPKAVLLNIATGNTTDVLGVGAGDEVWFNPGDRNYYVTGSGSPFRPLPAATAQGATPLSVVSSDGRLLQTLTTFNVPAGTGHPASTAHSVAVDSTNNHVYVPLGANNAFSAFAVPGGGPVPDCETGCIAVYAKSRTDLFEVE